MLGLAKPGLTILHAGDMSVIILLIHTHTTNSSHPHAPTPNLTLTSIYPPSLTHTHTHAHTHLLPTKVISLCLLVCRCVLCRGFPHSGVSLAMTMSEVIPLMQLPRTRADSIASGELPSCGSCTWLRTRR